MAPAVELVRSKEWATFPCADARRSKASSEERVHKADGGVGAKRNVDWRERPQRPDGKVRALEGPERRGTPRSDADSFSY